MKPPLIESVSVAMATKCSSGVSMTTDHMVHHGRPHRSHRHAYVQHRKTAVELLEESKGEYVKSRQVLNHRQELKHPENLSIGHRDFISGTVTSGKISPQEDSSGREVNSGEDSRTKSSPTFQSTLSSTSNSKLQNNSTSPPTSNKSSTSATKTAPSSILSSATKTAPSSTLSSATNTAPSSTLSTATSTPSHSSGINAAENKGGHSSGTGNLKTPPKPPRRNLHEEFTKPATPPKPAHKPAVPPRPGSAVKSTPPVPGPKPSVIQSTPAGKPVPPRRTVYRPVSASSSVPSDDLSEPSNMASGDKIPATVTKPGETTPDQRRFSSVSANACVNTGDSDVSGAKKSARESRHSVSSQSDTFLKPFGANSLSTSVGVLVERKRSPLPKPRIDKQLKEIELPPRRQLHRSQSDLSSCRHSRTSSDFSDLSSRLSRTSTEVERFFNEMGIDRSVLEPMRKLCETKQKEFLDSLSSLDSQEEHSLSSQISMDRLPMESEQDLSEREPGTMSVVERNARIIKWLCNVRKARTVLTKTSKPVETPKDKS